jgi:BRCT domain type II-containing protein
MRSRASQARALFRVVTTQAAASTTAATSSASAATATAAAKSTRSAAAARRRRNAEAAEAMAEKKANLSNTKINGEHQTIFIKASSSRGASSSMGHSLIAGLDPVNPPLSSLASVATQAFFALDRPLLEHQVISPSSKGSGSSLKGMSAESRQVMAEVQSTLENAKDAIMEAASRASRLSADQLSRTTFVITGSLNESGESKEVAWPKKIATLDHSRFVQLIDNLSLQGSGRNAVQIEAQALEEEEANRRDVESAVTNALERGEDTKVARSLGSEADLVVLGEPSGPNPEWPRGVATFLAERTRALEAPAAPSKDGVHGVEEGTQDVGIEELARHFAGNANAFTMQNMSEDDPNLMLSHAFVQATLPDRLRWDGVLSKMNAATGVEGDRASRIVDVSALNADLLATTAEDASEDDDVHLDSVKRKRKKKMRKHKYRKFRKATRVERNRLKK